MADIEESNSWDNGVYQLETSDPVEGGLEGIDNRPHKALANRTVWLKAQVALKALFGGSATQLFKVKAAVAGDEAVNKTQLEASLTGIITGFKNILINTELRVNQRAYDNSSVADGVYTYDRFKAVGGDATISSTGLITGIIAQVVEQQNIISGDYTFSNASCDVTIAGVTKTTPCTFTIAVASDIEVQ
ncbi:hypothetical protein [Sulfurimonas sp.]|uniref:hypothetical protein n=1 Tax=Sulfurimonas sp. TaxID=2022749 RepID=UPI0025D6BFAD|nr:hypothetical protein [Sulfurimonas sp.]